MEVIETRIDKFAPDLIESYVHGQTTECFKIGSDAFEVTLKKLNGRRVFVDYGTSPVKLVYRGAVDPSLAKITYAFDMPGEASACGFDLHTQSINYVAPGADSEGYLPPFARWANFNIDRALLFSLMQDYGDGAGISGLERQAYVPHRLDAAGHTRLEQMLGFAFSGVALSGSVAERFEDELLDVIVQPFLTGLDPRRQLSTTTNRRYQIACQVREAAQHGDAQNIGLVKLAQIAGVSVRTVEYAFKTTFGVSAGTYLRMLRLNRAYRDLLAADPSATSVTRVATHGGFWHLGEFSLAYRRLFGEVPSQTLHRRSGSQSYFLFEHRAVRPADKHSPRKSGDSGCISSGPCVDLTSSTYAVTVPESSAARA